MSSKRLFLSSGGVVANILRYPSISASRAVILASIDAMVVSVDVFWFA
jgi:hypothetical protein